jgi:hypothetical protein
VQFVCNQLQQARPCRGKMNFGSGIGGTMSTMIREQDGFIIIYDHKLKKLMMIELHGLQKKISRETWLDAASAKEAFYAGHLEK